MLFGMSRQSTRSRPARRPRRVPHHWLFPLALAYGALMLPLWLGFGPGYAAAWHGHELLFGYALLVAAGFLITRAGLPLLLGLRLQWQAGREPRRDRGLGLAISRAIIEQHGGEIGYVPNRPKGSCFYFTLPRVAG